MHDVPLSWARDVLRETNALTAGLPSDEVSAQPGVDVGKDPGKDPRFRALVEAVLFSRRFVSTYNIVLLGLLAIFTIWHWSEKVVLRRRSEALSRAGNAIERVDDVVDEAWSSSSSTIEGTVTPPDAAKKAVDETSPLLPAQVRSNQRSTGLWKPYYVVISWLQYQPPSIPIVNKTLPTNQVSLIILAFLGLNAFYNFYGMPMELKYLFVFADRCGLLFSANLPLLYLLAAKNQPIKFLTGYSYESLNIFHRRVGELLCFEALLHFGGMLFVWYGLLRHLGFTLTRFLFNRLSGLGLGTFASYEILYFTSLSSFRQRWYEIFLASHVFLQIAALVLLWFHYHTARIYVGIALATFLIDRIYFRLWLKSSTHPATLTVLEDGETILLSSNWNVEDRSPALIARSMKYGWNPNDHIFITVPQLSSKHVLQAHPFTIFSAAPTSNLPEQTEEVKPSHAWFTLLIRAQQDSGFTRTLLAYAQTNPTIRIRLDGPYGSSHALDILSASETAVIVAGGSGIAVAYPLLWALLSPTSQSTPDLEGGKPSTPKRKVKLLWIIHSASHQLWLPADKVQELQSWGLELLVPPPTSEYGRPDVKSLVQGWSEREVGRTGVVVSGPNGLVRDVRNTCAGLIRGGRDVEVQVEKFGW
ncbi:hypothetical protein BDV96DRAFT_574950 [Lophiotrema nucula]|uniref:FAD-binding FR-type domain-containing protein n=1 Tax=Lophiotrema nucula TaxID=690887 RepID=A0A6A5Z993_9PLEO|nr:hypothetical protein BDV96DRAFT_574950 [Lophiotrema nucula]